MKARVGWWGGSLVVAVVFGVLAVAPQWLFEFGCAVGEYDEDTAAECADPGFNAGIPFAVAVVALCIGAAATRRWQPLVVAALLGIVGAVVSG